MSDRNCWGTPPELFKDLHRTYNFTVDAAANADNAKLPRYWDEAADGLAQPWRGERVWCNPPYGRGLIEPWVDKGLDAFGFSGAPGMVMYLLPSRTETAWFQALLEREYRGYASINFLPKRIRFVPPPGIKASSPTEASILVRLWT